MAKEEYFVWWEEDEYRKYLGQFRLQLNGILFSLRKYGQDTYVDGATRAIMELVEQFGMKIRGLDMPYQITTRLVSEWNPPSE